MCLVCLSQPRTPDNCAVTSDALTTISAVFNEGADAPASVATPYAISVGDSFEGTLNPVGEHDWIEVTLVAGQEVTVSLTGGTLADPFLRLRDDNGAVVAFNDDFNGLDSQLNYTSVSGGTYYIDVGSFADSYGGTYTVDVIETPPPAPFDPLDGIDWGTALASNTINVYFGPAGFSGSGVTSEGFNAYEIQQFQAAFDIIEAAVDVQFNIVNNAANADFLLILDTNEMSALGFFNPPNTGPDSGIGAFNGAAWDRTAGGDLEVGGFGFVTIIHELGHGLGLAHPHDTGGSSSVYPGVFDPFGDTGTFDLNQGVFTTMSYVDGFVAGPVGTAATTQNFGYQASMMALDLGVLQDRYGENTTTNSGDTNYVLPDSNAAGTFWSTIWDVSGNDTMSHNGSSDAFIDLRAATLQFEIGGGGFISAVDNIQGGFTIANGVEIENGSGGSGDDVLVGNNLDNELLGNDGNDTLDGGIGNDTLNGGDDNDSIVGAGGNDFIEDGGLGDSDGVDTIDAGAGNDTVAVHFFRSNESVDGGVGTDLLDTSLDSTADLGVDLVNGTLTGGGASADISGFENVNTGSGNNTVIGSGDANRIDTGAGNDTVLGGAGIDTILGGGGDDSLEGGTTSGNGDADFIDGGAGNDVIIGGNQAAADAGDTLLGGVGDDSIVGNKGDDSLEGSNGNDTLQGGIGDDTHVGGTGHDLLQGRGGSDLFDAGGGNDVINADAGNDTVTGGGGNDTITGGGQNDAIAGGAGEDLIRGGNGSDDIIGGTEDDRLLGGFGADTIDGGEGNDDIRGDNGLDVLTGGLGDDVLRGGSQSDIFIFEDGFGSDTIIDFDAIDSGEKMDFSGLGAIVDFNDLMTNHVTALASRVIIDDGLGNSIRVDNVQASDLDASDFIFS